MINTELTADEVLLDGLRRNEGKALEKFYIASREGFIKWAMKNFKCDEYEITDTYQDAVTILYENVVSGRYTKGESSLKTYLYGIAKNLFYKKIEKARRVAAITYDLPDATIAFFEVENELDQKLAAAQRAFEAMREPCKSILNFFYYHKLSMTEIALKLGYKSDQVVKSQKVRCLKSLREEAIKISTNG
jgi:RNA polymerase sigma-70 factor (ECF subfamily)